VIFLANTIAWLGEVVAGFLFFEMFLVFARAFVQIFYGGTCAFGWTLREMTEPLVRPVRRLTAPLHLAFDLAPILAGIVLFVAQGLVLAGSTRLAAIVAGPYVGPPPHPAVISLVEGARLVLWLYILVVLLRVLVTWFGSPEVHPFVRFLSRLVDPPLRSIRRLIRPRYGRVDFAPLLLLAGLWFLDRVVLETLLYTL
jgi:YggT family protein